jgi:hypothetical protein
MVSMVKKGEDDYFKKSGFPYQGAFCLNGENRVLLIFMFNTVSNFLKVDYF